VIMLLETSEMRESPERRHRNSMSRSDLRVNCIREGSGVYPPGFELNATLVRDHSTLEVSAAFFRESISRPIIVGRNL